MNHPDRTLQEAAPAGQPAPVSPSVPPEIPETTCPWETWHSEAYLIAHLCRHHGWVATAPGRLERFRRRSIAAVPAPRRSEVA